MNWYFNNQGAAQGPYDDEDMRAQVKKGLVGAKTLVWQATMELWQEAARLNPTWWQPLPPKTKPLQQPQGKPAAEPMDGEPRRTVPLAPIGSQKGGKVRDFFKKLFGKES